MIAQEVDLVEISTSWATEIAATNLWYHIKIWTEICSVSELWQQQNQSTIDPRNFNKETTVSPPILSSSSSTQQWSTSKGSFSSWSNDCSRGGFGRNILSSIKIKPSRRSKDTFTNIHQPHDHQCGCHSQKALNFKKNKEYIYLYYLIQRHSKCIFDPQWVLKEKKQL